MVKWFRSYTWLKLLIKICPDLEKAIMDCFRDFVLKLKFDHEKVRIRKSEKLEKCSFMSYLSACQISEFLD